MNEAPQHPQAGEATDRAFWWGLGGLVVLAFAVRLVYLFQIEPMPFFYHPVADAAADWTWAGRIARGDWLGSETLYQAPAYPYFLALMRLTLGADLWRVRLVQMVLGAVSCGLLALAGRWFISRSAGWCAGVVVALYAPAMFFDGLIQKAALSFFLMALLLCLLGWMARGAHGTVEGSGRGSRALAAATALAVGVVSGLLALTHEQTLVLGPVLLVWLMAPIDRVACPSSPTASAG
ncbi:MAG: hypothetical protein V2A79_14045, partial [Planctomycetota bacterium]